jgi:hypothetical protein
VVVPRGAAAILIRESAQQRRIQFLGMTANPIDAQIITAKYRAALLRETAAAMELPVDEVVPSDDELTKAAEAAAQAQQGQMEAMQQAQAQEQQNKVDIEKLRLEGQGMKDQANLIAEVVKQAVTAALAQQKPVAGGKKKVKFSYDAAGNIQSADEE